ncbi:MAG: alpha-1,4-glucan--maltose-1-phosphate maltosyltransferase [Synergistaceae bacterium]|nr:alpha-1,4-glucan--maltose-1-phosphate maltosyltransferase [Synergistaceae bacterium]
MEVGGVEGRARVVIENVEPHVREGGPVRRCPGETVHVRADVYADGHDAVRAELLYRPVSRREWFRVPMIPVGDDRWEAVFTVESQEDVEFTLRGWVDRLETQIRDLRRRDAGQVGEIEFRSIAEELRALSVRASADEAGFLQRAAENLEKAAGKAEAELILSRPEILRCAFQYPDPELVKSLEETFKVTVERGKMRFSSWYEFFPRSACLPFSRKGTLQEARLRLKEIARMGFDVVYLPPIHPIGKTCRKGRNNGLLAEAGDPGSPWAIGSELGGHDAVDPQLGTLDDLREFREEAETLGMEVALDLAFQCSPDHPYIRQHPEWFRWRPDGSIQYAENPPKKYEDIVPFNFETPEWRSLWEELRRVVLFWVGQGFRLFRVDNPHTKPFAFWQWLISEVKRQEPDALFLAEAFTRPKVMKKLARVGFCQSYTYFTWRNTKQEIVTYLRELTETEMAEYFQPNFWPNTPDILPEFLQFGGRAAYVIRMVLAATLSSCWGVYGPPFELLVSEAVNGKEEYMDSEKYEIKAWDWDQPGNLRDLIARVNRIRRRNPALQQTRNLRFLECENENLVAYLKTAGENTLLIVVSLDPFRTQTGALHLPLSELGMEKGHPFLLEDLLGGEKVIWYGEWNSVTLDPQELPARLFALRRHLKREQDFDYFA